MPRKDVLYLEDMAEGADKVQRYTKGLTLATFEANSMVVDATLRNLEIIGEAAKSVSALVKASHPEVDWRGMARFRDALAHHYFGINIETIWDVVENEIPPLTKHLRTIRKELEE